MRVRKTLLISGLLMLGIFPSVAATSQWAKVIGGGESDTAYSIRQTRDGGYILAGTTSSFGAGGSDAWVLKVDQNGTVLWQKTYGGPGHDVARSAEQTTDGGYIVAGETDSSGAGSCDAWVLKIDQNGKVLWQRTYGDFGHENAYSIRQTVDGGYIVAGATGSWGAGGLDAWVLKLDSQGAVLWQRAYGGSGHELARAIRPTPDGGYIVAGHTNSSGAGGVDGWVFKLDQTGRVQWQKTYGGSDNDPAHSIETTADGGYIVVGQSESLGGSDSDAWVLRLDHMGTTLWQKAITSSVARSLQQTSDGGHIVAGEWGGSDAGVLKLDDRGKFLWQRSFGRAMHLGYSIEQASESGYVVAGSTGASGGNDCFLLKMDDNGMFDRCALIGTSPIIVTSADFREQPSSAVMLTTGITPRPAKTAGVNSGATSTTLCWQSDPGISVSPATHQFCAMTVGSRQKERFTIANRGKGELKVSKWGRSGDGSDIFIVGAGEGNPCPDHPFSMGPGNSCTLMAMFNPTSSGLKSAVLTIESDDPDQPLLSIPLEGTVTPGEPDLTISLSAEAPISCRGEKITTNSIVSNIPVSADTSYSSAPTVVKFYLSADESLGPDDILLGERFVPCLEGDSTDRAFKILTLPPEMKNGKYYLLGVVDPENTVREAREGNNFSALPLYCP